MNPNSPLNPYAQEWRNTYHHHIQQAAAAEPVLLPNQPYLVWHLQPDYGFMAYYFPRAWSSDFVYHFTPSAFPATGCYYEVAPPFHGGEKKYAAHLEEISEIGVKWKKDGARPCRAEWKLKKSGGGGGGAADSSVSPLKKIDTSSSMKTTVMIKNIPNQLRRDFMLEFLDNYCRSYSLEYDFMYLPMDFCSEDNLGYAFVNFTNGDYANKFKKILHNYKWGEVQTNKGVYLSKKICALTWARIQGKEKLVKRFEDSVFACDDPSFLPVVFDTPRNGSNNTSPTNVGSLKVRIDSNVN